MYLIWQYVICGVLITYFPNIDLYYPSYVLLQMNI